MLVIYFFVKRYLLPLLGGYIVEVLFKNFEDGCKNCNFLSV